MQRVPPSQASTATVPLSAPLRPRFLVGGVKMYLKSAISRTFCQGYKIIGVRGANVVIVVVEDGCCSSGQVVFLGRSLVVVVFTNREAQQSRAYQSPLVEVQ